MVNIQQKKKKSEQHQPSNGVDGGDDKASVEEVMGPEAGGGGGVADSQNDLIDKDQIAVLDSASNTSPSQSKSSKKKR